MQNSENHWLIIFQLIIINNKTSKRIIYNMDSVLGYIDSL